MKGEGFFSHGSEMDQKAGQVKSAPRHGSVTVWLELVQQPLKAPLPLEGASPPRTCNFCSFVRSHRFGECPGALPRMGGRLGKACGLGGKLPHELLPSLLNCSSNVILSCVTPCPGRHRGPAQTHRRCHLCDVSLTDSEALGENVRKSELCPRHPQPLGYRPFLTAHPPNPRGSCGLPSLLGPLPFDGEQSRWAEAMTLSFRDLRQGWTGRSGLGRFLPDHSLARKNPSRWTVSRPREIVLPRSPPESCQDWPRGKSPICRFNNRQAPVW